MPFRRQETGFFSVNLKRVLNVTGYESSFMKFASKRSRDPMMN